jgi:hypothetical protein
LLVGRVLASLTQLLFNDPGEQINLVPMKKDINGSGGSWYKMEKEWADELVKVKNSDKGKR